ncbi:MAG: hypothetical protein ACI8TX_003702, partial [Hyphomicrobiaceae bacterium]
SAIARGVGDHGFAAPVAQQQAFISVDKFGGSDSLLIRANFGGLLRCYERAA